MIDELPRQRQIEPVRGVKVASALLGERSFRPMSWARDYYLEDTALCLLTREPRHPAPRPECGCGFYAWRQPVPVMRGYSVQDLYLHLSNGSSFTPNVLLEVEFTGIVVEHEHGYRAQHQRVLTIHVRDLHAEVVHAAFPVDVVAHQSPETLFPFFNR